MTGIKIYGKGGLFNIKMVIPKKKKRRHEKILETIVEVDKVRFSSFLNFLAGEIQKRIILFPFEGYTLALDFKINEEN